MKKRIVAAMLLGCMLLSGCTNVFDGHYSSVKLHKSPSTSPADMSFSAKNPEELYNALTRLVEAGKKEAVIIVDGYDQTEVVNDTHQVSARLQTQHPIGAYAVEQIRFKHGKSGDKPALTVYIGYSDGRSDVDKIQTVNGIGQLEDAICEALDKWETGLVLLAKAYDETDLTQIVEDHAMENPQQVMEMPQVLVTYYPETGEDRVVDLRFVYQTNRESLKAMQEQVISVFSSAALYVGEDAEQKQKYSQLWSFLMERFDYQINTSITPSYSLLHHGVGDSRAFMQVYSAMCRQVGLECMMVSGTKDGESHYWTIIRYEDTYYHLDLLEGSFHPQTDEQMRRYVWDYSAYPVCGVPHVSWDMEDR